MLYSVYAVLGVCCTRCMLYLLYAVLGVSCTWCMLYLVYACTRCQLMIMGWSDGEWSHNFVFCDDERTNAREKQRWGMMMRTMWRIRASMRNRGCNLPDWVGKTSYWCFYMPDRVWYLLFRDDKSTLTRKSLKSLFLMMIWLVSSQLSPSRPQLYHHLRTQS